MALAITQLRNVSRDRARRYEARSRSVVAFDGSAGGGESDAPSIVTVFTITGRVFVTRITAFCTATLVSAGGGTLALSATGGATMIAATIAANIATNDIWVDASPTDVGCVVVPAALQNQIISANIILTIATADITGGTLIFDVWYEPITENGLLS